MISDSAHTPSPTLQNASASYETSSKRSTGKTLSTSGLIAALSSKSNSCTSDTTAARLPSQANRSQQRHDPG